MSITANAGAQKALFVDQSDQDVAALKPWPAMIVTRDEIDREIARLADARQPANGRRASAIVHPSYANVGHGISHGFDAVINVLKPGEETSPIRTNSNRVEFGIRGTGVAVVNGVDVQLRKWDTLNIPSMQRYQHRNTGDDLLVWFSFSNTPLLETLGAHYSEKDPPVRRLAEPRPRKLNEGSFDIGLPDGGRLQSAEYLAEIDIVPSRAHRWSWDEVHARLAFAPHTENRDLVLLYNPATERRAGTSASFFVTMLGATATEAVQPPIRWGHRHTPATLLYQMQGVAIADIDGERMVWDEGDLIMAAPSWARHSINVGLKDGVPGDWSMFALQDHPPHIAQESLVWQDDADEPIGALGLGEEMNYLAFEAKLRSDEDKAALSA